VFQHSVEHVVGEADGEEEGHNLRVIVVHDRSSGPARSFLCPRRSSRRWCQGSRHDGSWPVEASGATRQGAESVDAPGACYTGSFGPSHRLDGYTQANKASARVVGRKGSVSGKRKGDGASGASFSPLRQNTKRVMGAVVTGRLCNSWVAPLLLAAVHQSILAATSSTRQGAEAATLGEDEDTVTTAFPPSAARYGGSMAVSTSWAQHGAATGRSAGDVGAATSPAPRVAVALGRRLPLLFCSPTLPLHEQQCDDSRMGVMAPTAKAPRRLGQLHGLLSTPAPPSFFSLLLLSLAAGNWIWMGKKLGGGGTGVEAGIWASYSRAARVATGWTVGGDSRRRGKYPGACTVGGGHGGAARSLPHCTSRKMPRGRKEVGEDVAGWRDPHVSGTGGGM
jgi:hypothetical protein